MISWPLLQDRGDRLHGLDDVGHVRVLGLAKRRRHADVDDVGVGEALRVGGRDELAVLDHFGQVLGRDVGDVAAAGHQLGDLALVDVEADHAEAGARELHRQRQADVAEADDAQLRLLRLRSSSASSIRVLSAIKSSELR